MDQKEVRIHQKEFLHKLKSRKFPTSITIQGVTIFVNPSVFPPATDTLLLAEYVKVQPNDTFVDLTTGSGIIAVIAGMQGATGYASDINADAVKNAKENILKFHIKVRALQSDLFSKIPKEKFDYIFANGPYIEGDITDPLEYAFFGARKYATELFNQAPKFLKPQGKMFVTFAEWGEKNFFEQEALKNKFTFKILDKKTSTDGERTYLLYEFEL